MIDAHCHIDFASFDNQRKQLLASCFQTGIRRIVVPGTIRESWRKILNLAWEHPILLPALGLHPWWAAQANDDSLDELEQLLAVNNQIVAVGECGLDIRRGPPLAQQRGIFEAQIHLAQRYDRPLLIHSVGTHDTVLSLLRQAHFEPPVLMHGFSGSWEQARALVDRGAFIGVSGVITHGRARKTHRVMADLPLESLVLETDAPGLAPEGVSSEGNTPLNLPRILDALCALRKEPKELVAGHVRENTLRLFMQRMNDEGLQEQGAPV
ncbi:TatD family hydrolase [Salicola sp. Rm-C-2C1-2]|uniref:TatD family hydrolase n=1 Tax=Salicola sp. Rm-C-2C1-2 TaxID=3141321 RepID=UPI0032E45926